MEPPEGTDVEDDIKAGRYTEAEVESFDSENEVRSGGLAYALIQGTRPATLGLAIGSSPVALLP